MNILFPVVNFLKCVVTEVVLFLIVAFTDISRGSVATHLRCGGIFSDSLFYYKCCPDSDSEISLKIGQYLMKLRRVKLKNTKVCQFFGPPFTVAELHFTGDRNKQQ